MVEDLLKPRRGEDRLWGLKNAHNYTEAAALAADTTMRYTLKDTSKVKDIAVVVVALQRTAKRLGKIIEELESEAS